MPTIITKSAYRIVVFGDSVLWGQGLKKDLKIHELVKTGIQERLPSAKVMIANMAHSGAVIGFNDASVEDTNPHPPLSNAGEPNEVNWSYPTILQQVAGFDNHPDTVDLVLVDGGINDVNVRRLLPSVDDAKLSNLIDTHCRVHMIRLLDRIAHKFPNAKVIVTGYYPIISEVSDFGLLKIYLSTLGLMTSVLAAATTPSFVAATQLFVAANCTRFYQWSEIALQRAVDEINAKLGAQEGRRAFLAAPEFARENSVLAPSAWLFGLNAAGEPVDNPALRAERRKACEQAYKSDPIGLEICKRASAGHPNPQGAKAFAEEVLAVIDTNGLLGPARFPAGFLWGSATAAYQVEGGIENNDWHLFTTDRNIRERVNFLGTAVDLDIHLQPAGDGMSHRHLDTLGQDLDRMVALGMNAYRFSIEWSRVEPRPTRFSPTALDYYRQVIDAAIARGLKPIVTLNHLTLPLWVLTPPTVALTMGAAGAVNVMADAGFNDSLQGWENPKTVDAFIKYVNRVVDEFKDKVDTWITLNEPAASMIGIGYIGGVWSPGFLDGDRGKKAYFNLLRAHARAYDEIKAKYSPADQVKVGIAHAMLFAKPPDVRDVLQSAGTLNGSDEIRLQFDYFMNWHFLNSLLRDEVDITLDKDYRDGQILLDKAQAMLRVLERVLARSIEQVQELATRVADELQDMARFLRNPARRQDVADAWRAQGRKQAANAARIAPGFDLLPPDQQRGVEAAARGIFDGAFDLAEDALKTSLAALALGADVLGDLVEGASSLPDLTRQLNRRIEREVRQEISKVLGGITLPQELSPQELVTTAAATVLGLPALRQALAELFRLRQDKRSAEAKRKQAQQGRDRKYDIVQALLQQAGLSTTETSQQFFGLPFKPRLDFIGINYYRSVYVLRDLGYEAFSAAFGSDFMGGYFKQEMRKSGHEHHLLNDLTWEIYPRGLYALLKEMHERYRKPVLITENGIAEANDRNRAAYIVSHVQQTLRAVQEGVDVQGYLHWSIVDNFEWFEHYNPEARFGLFTVDGGPGSNSGVPLRRHITEGALALQYMIAVNGMGQAVEKFGSINSKGYLVSPPLRSPGSLWEGSFRAGTLFSANQKFTLYLSQLSTGTWLGMVFLRQDNAWHRLENLQRSGNSLSFSLAFGGGKHVFQATVSGDAIQGTTNAGSQAQSWQAQRVRLFGNWASASGPAAFQVRRLEGEFENWRVKVHGASNKNQQWNAGTQPSSDGATLAFNIGTNRVDAQLLADGTLSGTSTSQLPGVQAVKWQAVRLGE